MRARTRGVYLWSCVCARVRSRGVCPWPGPAAPPEAGSALRAVPWAAALACRSLARSPARPPALPPPPAPTGSTPASAPGPRLLCLPRPSRRARATPAGEGRQSPSRGREAEGGDAGARPADPDLGAPQGPPARGAGCWVRASAPARLAPASCGVLRRAWGPRTIREGPREVRSGAPTQAFASTRALSPVGLRRLGRATPGPCNLEPCSRLPAPDLP